MYPEKDGHGMETGIWIRRHIRGVRMTLIPTQREAAIEISTAIIWMTSEVSRRSTIPFEFDANYRVFPFQPA